MGGLFVMENNVHILIRRAYFDANDKRNLFGGILFFLQELENCSIMKEIRFIISGSIKCVCLRAGGKVGTDCFCINRVTSG